MKKLNFLVLLCMVAIGCSNNSSTDSKIIDSNTFMNQLKSAPSAGVSKENLPEWLIGKINEIEIIHSKDISIIKVRIYKGEWKNRTVYYIFDSFQSCMFCEVYYDNGTNIVWTANDIASDIFCTTSKNWVLIYEFGEGIY